MAAKAEKNKGSLHSASGEVVSPAKEFFSSRVLKWAPAGILLLTALLYTRAFFDGFTSFDDDAYIVNNPLISEFSLKNIKLIFTSFYAGNYHPFTLLTYLLEYTCFGPDPMPYHIVNVVLHLVNTWLVFRVAERLSGNRVTGLIVSLLFAIHPMHVESVVWASETKDVLYAMFYLLAMLSYFRYLESDFRWRFYITTLIFFIASLFSKSAAVTLPVLMVVIDVYKGRTINMKSLTEKIPFVLLSVLFGILNLLSQHADKAFTNLSETYNVLNRIVLVSSSLFTYFLKLVAPFNLSAMHFFPRQHGNMLPGQYYTSLAFVVFAVLLLVLLKRSALKRELLFGIAFFLITISVMLQIVAVGSVITAERYTYIPYIGLFYVVGRWISGLDLKKNRNVFAGIFLLVLTVFSIQTWARIGVWENDTTLYTDIRNKDPKVSKDMAYGFFNRGNERKMTGAFDDARADYSQSILLDPDFYEAYCNRGYVYQRMNDIKSAMVDFNAAINLHPEKPDAYNNRGGIFFQMHDIKSAMEDFNKAISLKPGYVEAYTNRGWAYFNMNDAKAAIDDYDKAISLKPDFAEAYNSRGWIYFTLHDTRMAVSNIEKAIELKPDFIDAYINLGWVYNAIGDPNEAIVNFNKAISLNPRYAVAYNKRGQAYYSKPDVKSAIADFSKAISLDSSYAEAYANRGWAYLQTGDSKAALADYYKVISLDPNNALAYNNVATIRGNTGDLAGALEYYNMFLKLQPNDAVGYNDRGTVRYNLKDIPGACGDWRKAIELGDNAAAAAVRDLCH